MKTHHVGQIVYLLSKNDMSLLPVLIVEEHVRRTIEGEEIAYIAETLGINGNNKRFNLDASKVDIFDDIKIAREFLINNAVSAIDSLCDVASKKVIVFKERIDKRLEEKNVLNRNEDDVQDLDYVLLENGRKAKIKTNLTQGT